MITIHSVVTKAKWIRKIQWTFQNIICSQSIEAKHYYSLYWLPFAINAIIISETFQNIPNISIIHSVELDSFVLCHLCKRPQEWLPSCRHSHTNVKLAKMPNIFNWTQLTISAQILTPFIDKIRFSFDGEISDRGRCKKKILRFYGNWAKRVTNRCISCDSQIQLSATLQFNKVIKLLKYPVHPCQLREQF